ncbi:cupin domain-containing protein [Streptomyces niveus]|uniref:cupin domain-containing protein n=1 Tax=Streptomyces niveus TaxID=193462 RepID=UPI00368F72BE
MPSPHWVSLTQSAPTFQNDLGSVQIVDGRALPILSRLSVKRVVLARRAIREPQWNVNANQLAYVVRGQVLVSMLGDGNEFSSFVVDEGQMYTSGPGRFITSRISVTPRPRSSSLSAVSVPSTSRCATASPP